MKGAVRTGGGLVLALLLAAGCYYSVEDPADGAGGGGAGGSCAVHGQAARVTTEPYWFTCLYRPNEERCFVSIVNVTGQRMTGRISYPLGVAGIEPREHPVALGPHAATLHEIRLDAEAAARIGDAPLALNMLFDRLHKAHFLCSSPNLDRFSIDHL